MVSISLCMIVKDEESVLKRCLKSIKDIVDEIIIVDTGSKDRTKEIAKEFTNKIYDYEWVDNFSNARNFSFSKATKEYILWLDADDVILDEDKKKFIKMKENMSNDIDVVMMKYNTLFDENGNVVFSYYRERLIKNIRKDMWNGYVHEAIVPFGKIEYSNIAVTHKKIKKSYSDRNIKIFEKLLNNGVVFSPREQFYYSRELLYHNKFNNAIDGFEKFLNMDNGFLENKIDALRMMSYCYKNIGQTDKEIEVLFRTFKYDTPRAEVCCDIGNYFVNINRYNDAIYWYKAALNCSRKDILGGFILEDCYGYIPLIQLCVCYDKIGNTNLANEYNELAGIIKPAGREYMINREYFKNIFS